MKWHAVLPVLLLLLLSSPPLRAQGTGINTATPAAGAMLEVAATNKGVLIPRIGYGARPTNNVENGMLIYVTADGPQGNNAFYYYNGSDWVKFYNYSSVQSLALVPDTLSISNGNKVFLGSVFPVAGFIKCSTQYINPLTNNSNCGLCGFVCPGATTCVGGTCQ